MYSNVKVDKLSASRLHYYEKEKDILYMVTNGSSVLLKINMKTNEIENSFILPSTKNESGYDYIDIIKNENEIYLARYDGKGVVVINEKFGNISSIEIDISKNYKDTNRVTRCIRVINKDLIIVSKEDIYIYDLEYKSIEKIYEGDDTTDFCFDNEIIHEKMYIPSISENKIITIDLNNMEVSENTLKHEKILGYNSITCMADRLYLVAKNGLIFSCDIKLDNIELVTEVKGEIQKLFVLNKDDMYAVGMINPVIWRAGKNYSEEIKIQDFYSEKKYESATKFEMIFIRGKKIYLQSRIDGVIYIFDTQRETSEKINILIGKELRGLIVNNYMKKHITIIENEPIELNAFLETICCNE